MRNDGRTQSTGLAEASTNVTLTFGGALSVVARLDFTRGDFGLVTIVRSTLSNSSELRMAYESIRSMDTSVGAMLTHD
jgi:hypothetical protein